MAATRVLYMEERTGQDPDPCYLREFDARVVERGPHAQLVANAGRYAELYRTQFAVADSPRPFTDAVGPEPVVVVRREELVE